MQHDLIDLCMTTCLAALLDGVEQRTQPGADLRVQEHPVNVRSQRTAAIKAYGRVNALVQDWRDNNSVSEKINAEEGGRLQRGACICPLTFPRRSHVRAIELLAQILPQYGG